MHFALYATPWGAEDPWLYTRYGSQTHQSRLFRQKAQQGSAERSVSNMSSNQLASVHDPSPSTEHETQYPSSIPYLDSTAATH